MLKPQLKLLWIVLFFIGPEVRFSRADIGTASRYSPPYTPTACYGNDVTEFPSSNLFGAAGESIWDNGAACGRQYVVRCISAPAPGSCVPGQAIQVKIVDRAQTASSRPTREGSSIVLSNVAFSTIANGAAQYLNVDLQQL